MSRQSEYYPKSEQYPNNYEKEQRRKKLEESKRRRCGHLKRKKGKGRKNEE